MCVTMLLSDVCLKYVAGALPYRRKQHVRAKSSSCVGCVAWAFICAVGQNHVDDPPANKIANKISTLPAIDHHHRHTSHTATAASAPQLTHTLLQSWATFLAAWLVHPALPAPDDRATQRKRGQKILSEAHRQVAALRSERAMSGVESGAESMREQRVAVRVALSDPLVVDSASVRWSPSSTAHRPPVSPPTCRRRRRNGFLRK